MEEAKRYAGEALAKVGATYPTNREGIEGEVGKLGAAAPPAVAAVVLATVAVPGTGR